MTVLQDEEVGVWKFFDITGSIDRHGVQASGNCRQRNRPNEPTSRWVAVWLQFWKKASWKQLLIQNSDPWPHDETFWVQTSLKTLQWDLFWAGFKRMQIVEDSESEEQCFAPNLDRDNLTLSLTRFPSTWCFHNLIHATQCRKDFDLWVSMCFHDVNAIWTLIRSSCTFLFRQEFLPRMKLLPNQRRRKLRQRVNFLGRVNGLSGVNEKTT